MRFSGILLALYHRERTGRGTSFEVSLFEALGEWMAQPAYFSAYGGSPPPRSGAKPRQYCTVRSVCVAGRENGVPGRAKRAGMAHVL